MSIWFLTSQQYNHRYERFGSNKNINSEGKLSWKTEVQISNKDKCDEGIIPTSAWEFVDQVDAIGILWDIQHTYIANNICSGFCQKRRIGPPFRQSKDARYPQSWCTLHVFQWILLCCFWRVQQHGNEPMWSMDDG